MGRGRARGRWEDGGGCCGEAGLGLLALEERVTGTDEEEEEDGEDEDDVGGWHLQLT